MNIDYDFMVDYEGATVHVYVDGEEVTIASLHDIINYEGLLDIISATIAARDAIIH